MKPAQTRGDPPGGYLAFPTCRVPIRTSRHPYGSGTTSTTCCCRTRTAAGSSPTSSAPRRRAVLDGADGIALSEADIEDLTLGGPAAVVPPARRNSKAAED